MKPDTAIRDPVKANSAFERALNRRCFYPPGKHYPNCRRGPYYAAISPERQTDVSLQRWQTRSPMWFEMKSREHIRHFRFFLTGGRSGFGFLVFSRREATIPPFSFPQDRQTYRVEIELYQQEGNASGCQWSDPFFE